MSLPAAGAEGLREELEPLEDGLIRRCLRAGDWASGGKSLWHRMLDFLVGEPGACRLLLLRSMRLLWQEACASRWREAWASRNVTSPLHIFESSLVCNTASSSSLFLCCASRPKACGLSFSYQSRQAHAAAASAEIASSHALSAMHAAFAQTAVSQSLTY